MERMRYRAVRSPLRRGASMIYGFNRYEIKKTREQPEFSPFSGQKQLVLSLIVAFERQQNFAKNPQNK